MKEHRDLNLKKQLFLALYENLIKEKRFVSLLYILLIKKVKKEL